MKRGTREDGPDYSEILSSTVEEGAKGRPEDFAFSSIINAPLRRRMDAPYAGDRTLPLTAKEGE